MNIAETISVNPVDKTLGALNPEVAARFIREHNVIATPSAYNKKDSLNFCFASSAPGVNRFAGYMLLFRAIFSTLLIVSGSFILSGEILSSTPLLSSQLLGVSEILIGSFLLFGFLSRFVMGISTLLFGYLSVMAVMSGVFDMQNLLCCMGSLIFTIAGVGKYSADFLIRKAIIRRAISRRNKMKADRLTYRAYSLYHCN